MDIELDQTFAAHFQKEGLASFRIRDIGAPHDLVDCERLLAERAQDIFSIIQQERRAPIERWCKSLADHLQHDLVALGAGGERLHPPCRHMTCVHL